MNKTKNTLKVFLLEGIHHSVEKFFTDKGYAVECHSKALDEKELIAKLPGISILGIRSKTQITEKVLDNAKDLIAIGAFCIGFNQIDLKSCTQKGIAVFNAPYSSTTSVAEMVIGKIICLSRRILEKSMKMHNGKWDKSSTSSTEIFGKKLGIIGYGNIGQRLSMLAENMGMEVFYYDILDKKPIGNASKCESMEEVLRTADIVTLHVDGKKENTNMISVKEFGQMKRGVIFINSSRGNVLDVDALVDALNSGKVRAAALDVFKDEPENGDEFISPLRGLKNVVLTPHIGGSTEEAQKRIGEFVFKQVMNYLETGSTQYCLNMPQLEYSHSDCAISYLHLDKTGMLNTITSAIASHGVNITGTSELQIKDGLGYIVIKINRRLDDNEIEKLKGVDGTISIRTF